MSLKLVIAFVLIVFTLVGKGQEKKDYFIEDSSTFIGVRLLDGGDALNARFCRVKMGKQILTYTAYQVKAYGFNDGRVYVSKEIQMEDTLKRVFLERLSSGKISLYYYRVKGVKTYFIQKDTTLWMEVPKINDAGEDYSKQLLQLTEDCANVSDACKLTAYKKQAVAELISRYNNCKQKPFPFFKYGLFFGTIQLKLELSGNNPDILLSKLAFNAAKNLYFGFFAEAPIDMSNLSVLSSVGIYKSSFSANVISDIYDIDALINQTTVKLPVLMRYNFPMRKIRPFVTAGINYSYNLRNETLIFKAKKDNEIIQYFTPSEEKLIFDHQLGYVYGAGLQCNIDYRRILFIEIRNTKEYALFKEGMFNKNDMEIICGINF